MQWHWLSVYPSCDQGLFILPVASIYSSQNKTLSSHHVHTTLVHQDLTTLQKWLLQPDQSNLQQKQINIAQYNLYLVSVSLSNLLYCKTLSRAFSGKLTLLMQEMLKTRTEDADSIHLSDSGDNKISCSSQFFFLLVNLCSDIIYVSRHIAFFLSSPWEDIFSFPIALQLHCPGGWQYWGAFSVCDEFLEGIYNIHP